MTAVPDHIRLDICGDPVDLIVRFLNTLDVDEGTDVLATFHGWRSWLVTQGLEGCCGAASPCVREQARELELARELRGELRALSGGEPCSQVRRVDIQVALSVDGQVELSAQTAVGLIAAAAATVAIQGRLGRVKICPADDCRWAFYDESRNQSRQWCSMKVCGNRAKARHHRARSAPA